MATTVPKNIKPIEQETKRKIDHERYKLLRKLDRTLETPMLVLGFVWLILLVIDLTKGLNPFLMGVGYIIWGIFVVDFLLKFFLAPRKLKYLKKNWLTEISLAVPALRVFSIFRVLRLLRLARAARGIRLVRVLTSLNRGMNALTKSMGRRGFAYIMLLTLIVVFAGAAGIYAFENGSSGSHGLQSYSAALYWTAMLMTTTASEYWPKTPEGRILTFVLAVYSVAVFGYITATLATFFIGRDAESKEGEIAGQDVLYALQTEVIRLRDEIAEMNSNKRRRDDGLDDPEAAAVL